MNPLTPMILQCLGLLGASHNASIFFLADGTVTSNASAPNTNSVLANWFAPTTGGVGNSFWIKFTLTSGNAWDAGIVNGAINALSATRSLTWTATTGTNKIGLVSVAIYSDAAGTTQVAGGTLSVDVESTN